ncbi:MAG: acyltransferase family protein, partial [Bacteroidota bacterium]
MYLKFTMELQGNRNFSIETLRGMGIMLVLAGHVIGSGPSGGMQVDNHSFLRYFYHSCIEYVQMPLFAAISGWVYAIQANRKESLSRGELSLSRGELSLSRGELSLSKFISKKAQRLLIPMIFTG